MFSMVRTPRKMHAMPLQTIRHAGQNNYFIYSEEFNQDINKNVLLLKCNYNALIYQFVSVIYLNSFLMFHHLCSHLLISY